MGTGAVDGVEFVPGVEAEDELPAFEPEFELTLVVALPAENGFAAPDPQPTTEAMARNATPNLINTLNMECTFETLNMNCN